MSSLVLIFENFFRVATFPGKLGHPLNGNPLKSRDITHVAGSSIHIFGSQELLFSVIKSCYCYMGNNRKFDSKISLNTGPMPCVAGDQLNYFSKV